MNFKYKNLFMAAALAGSMVFTGCSGNATNNSGRLLNRENVRVTNGVNNRVNNRVTNSAASAIANDRYAYDNTAISRSRDTQDNYGINDYGLGVPRIGNNNGYGNRNIGYNNNASNRTANQSTGTAQRGTYGSNRVTNTANRANAYTNMANNYRNNVTTGNYNTTADNFNNNSVVSNGTANTARRAAANISSVTNNAKRNTTNNTKTGTLDFGSRDQTGRLGSGIAETTKTTTQASASGQRSKTDKVNNGKTAVGKAVKSVLNNVGSLINNKESAAKNTDAKISGSTQKTVDDVAKKAANEVYKAVANAAADAKKTNVKTTAASKKPVVTNQFDETLQDVRADINANKTALKAAAKTPVRAAAAPAKQIIKSKKASKKTASIVPILAPMAASVQAAAVTNQPLVVDEDVLAANEKSRANMDAYLRSNSRSNSGSDELRAAPKPKAAETKTNETNKKESKPRIPKKQKGDVIKFKPATGDSGKGKTLTIPNNKKGQRKVTVINEDTNDASIRTVAVAAVSNAKNEILNETINNTKKNETKTEEKKPDTRERSKGRRRRNALRNEESSRDAAVRTSENVSPSVNSANVTDRGLTLDNTSETLDNMSAERSLRIMKKVSKGDYTTLRALKENNDEDIVIVVVDENGKVDDVIFKNRNTEDDDEKADLTKVTERRNRQRALRRARRAERAKQLRENAAAAPIVDKNKLNNNAPAIQSNTDKNILNAAPAVDKNITNPVEITDEDEGNTQNPTENTTENPTENNTAAPGTPGQETGGNDTQAPDETAPAPAPRSNPIPGRI